jgi:hypothetical protein
MRLVSLSILQFVHAVGETGDNSTLTCIQVVGSQML